jgi:predicted alpha/beta-hydrolase family hydrolase
VSWTIAVGSESTTAEYDPALGNQRGIFVCAHGAGGNMKDRATLAATNAMRRIGLGVVRFNFLYKEKGSGGPDRMPRLIECFDAVVARTRSELGGAPVVIGGRSMGGRVASMMAADGFDAAGLLLLAYPLHPPKQFDRLRDEHLPAIRMPVLCFNGTRDEFARGDLMDAAMARVGPNWRLHWLDGADHSFHVLKSSGRTDVQLLDEVASATRTWLDENLPVPTSR